jgi:hypothetical protein
MRQLSRGAQGVANNFTQIIMDPVNGTLLQVTRSLAQPQGKTGTRPLMAICEAPDADSINRIQVEGSFNALDAVPYIFTFVSGSDVKTGDTFIFQNFKYQLISEYPQPLGDAILGIRMLGIRTGKGISQL